jgi:uncharacterized iron-regulated protein
VRLLAWSVLLLLVALPSAHAGQERSYRFRDGVTVPFPGMIGEVAGSRVVFVGEDHDDRRHHRIQLRVIRALHRQKRPLFLGLEMFSATSQPALDLWNRGGMTEREFARLFAREWRMPWSLYGDIFRYARRNRIPLVGLNISRAISAKVARHGFAALSDAERTQLPPGVSCDVDATYMEFIRQAYRRHAGGGQGFLSFCEAQMVWDKSMAWHLGRYLADHQDRHGVVLVGNGHALKRGIPDELRGVASSVIIPESAGLTTHSLTAREADYLVLGRR